MRQLMHRAGKLFINQLHQCRREVERFKFVIKRERKNNSYNYSGAMSQHISCRFSSARMRYLRSIPKHANFRAFANLHSFVTLFKGFVAEAAFVKKQ